MRFIYAFMGILLVASIIANTTIAISPAMDPLPYEWPQDPERLGELLCTHLDLSTPGMEEVRREAMLGHYAAALSAWRDYQVDAFRKANLGTFSWHGQYLNQAGLRSADLMIGAIPETNAVNAPAIAWSSFITASGMIGTPDHPHPITWLARNAKGNVYDYSNFSFAIPLTVRYWQTGDAIYLNKWLQITADFARHQKKSVEALDPATRATVPCNWSSAGRDAQASLSQADRVQIMLRSIGVLCKSLPGKRRATRWEKIQHPVTEPLTATERDLISPVELAHIAFSMVYDHPDALRKRYLTVEAVPNQRRNGLTALLMTAVQFREFRVSQELLQETLVGLNDYLQGAFEKDGGMLEKSFNYNFGDAVALREMADWLRPTLPDMAERIDAKRTHFYRFAAALSTPFARLPAMASYGPVNPPPLWQNQARRETYLAAQINILPGRDDALVEQIAGQFINATNTPSLAFSSVVFPYSGFAALRRDGHWDSPYLFMQTSRPSRGHRSMGQNAIQVAAYGRMFLTSSGVPVYSPQQLPENLQADFAAINQLLGEHSSLKENTVIVDGQSQQLVGPVAAHAQEFPIHMRWSTSPQFDFTEGLYDAGYRGAKVDHRREVIFVRDPGFWIVTDRLINHDQRPHQFTQIWNFPPRLNTPNRNVYGFREGEVVLDAASQRIHTADPDGPNIWFHHFGPPSLTYVKHDGEKTPYLGWYTLGFGDLTPAPNVMVHWESQGDSELVTVLWPVANGSALDVQFEDLSRKSNVHDSAIAGFLLTLADGIQIRYETSSRAQPLGPHATSVIAQALLTVTANERIQGLVLGRTDAAPTDFEFSGKGDAMTEIIPMQIPKGFAWKMTPAGFVPEYSRTQED